MKDNKTSSTFLDSLFTEEQRAFFRQFLETIESIRTSMPKMLVDIEQALIILAEKGWYTPVFGEVPAFIVGLAHDILNGKEKRVDRTLIKMYKDREEELVADMVRKFPHRRQPIKAAFKAHYQKEYYLSIPVFLAQIEGIFNELVEQRFFKIRKGKGEPFAKQALEMLSKDGFSKAAIGPLLRLNEVNRPQVPNNPSGLNRHDVLHGDSNDYGNEINSYKTLSLLVYISDTVYFLKTGSW
jgi:hypothetical protein